MIELWHALQRALKGETLPRRPPHVVQSRIVWPPFGSLIDFER